jgi:hypothetical protein
MHDEPLLRSLGRCLRDICDIAASIVAINILLFVLASVLIIHWGCWNMLEQST